MPIVKMESESHRTGVWVTCRNCGKDVFYSQHIDTSSRKAADSFAVEHQHTFPLHLIAIALLVPHGTFAKGGEPID